MNPTGRLIWGDPSWWIPATTLVAVIAVLLLWSYRGLPAHAGWRMLAGILKIVGVVALALCLVEPLFSGVRPRPGANQFVVMVDNSQSLQLKDQGQQETRAEQLTSKLDSEAEWFTRLSQDFDVRKYLFDTRLRPAAALTDLAFDGRGSALNSALSTMLKRFEGRPTAGILLFTDGNATDLSSGSLKPSENVPIYPVLFGANAPERDIRIARVSSSQTNFEAAPVTIRVETVAQGFRGENLVLVLSDNSGKELQRHKMMCRADGEPLNHRFLVPAAATGLQFYQVRAFAEGNEEQFEDSAESNEATLANNTRILAVDRGGGPYRILYVAGRPNWEFKFLRRALQSDDEVNLVGMIRIAKKEPKFTFRGHMNETSNPLFRGFGNQDEEEITQYDQPVLIRIGTETAEELRDGFPQGAEELFKYDAIILDDLEAEFFKQDQLSLVQQFVSQRGGGFMMLGGRGSFFSGGYDRTPIGDMLPVYLDRPAPVPPDTSYQLSLTREGWLEPWIRLRTNEDDERKRLEAMPRFKTANRSRSIKPGATVLAQVSTSEGQTIPALVSQRFGKGQSAALLVGDMWRWQLRSTEKNRDDLAATWRQTARWLVGTVPQRVEVEVRPIPNDPTGTVEIVTRVNDELYVPLDNAQVALEVTLPEGRAVELSAEPADVEAGSYVARFSPQNPGGYRVSVVATAADQSEVGRRETGWTWEPETIEFQELQSNREFLADLAEQSGGELIELDQLDRFVKTLPNRKIPITEPWIFPIWHQWSVLFVAMTCLIGEWGIRRWKGLP